MFQCVTFVAGFLKWIGWGIADVGEERFVWDAGGSRTDEKSRCCCVSEYNRCTKSVLRRLRSVGDHLPGLSSRAAVWANTFT